MPDGNYDPASDLNPVYEDAGKRYGIDPDLLRAQTRVESGNNPYAVSSAGAEGMSQFIPSTAAAEGLNDPYDPHESIPAQAKLLRENADRFGSMTHAIGAYHSGSGDPEQWGPKTNAYLDAMNDEYSRIKAQAPAPQPQQQQPNIADQINSARQAGYSDGEIASYLQQSKTWAPKFDAARKAGYLDDEVLQHFGLKVQPGLPLTDKQEKALPQAKTEGSEAPQPAGHEPPAPQAPSGTPTAPAPTVAERAGNVWQAAKQAYQETPGFLTPMAQQWADAHGVGGDARVLGAALGAFNAVWSGAMETANQLGEAIGQPLLGRDAAAMIESAGMTGGPHAAIGESLRAAREGTPAAAQRPQTPQEAAPAAAGEIRPSAVPTTGTPAPEAPVAQATPGRTLEEEALSELNPEWTKPGLRERPQYGPPAPVAAEAHQELEQIAKGAPGEAAPPEQEPTPPPESPAGLGAPSQATPPMAPREEPVAQPPPQLPTPLQERYAQVSAAEAERSQEEEQKGTTENPPVSRNPVTPRSPTPFEATPKEPQRLIDFLRSKTVVAPGTLQESVIPGGVRDPGGDLRAILGGSKGRPGLINNASGMSLHDKLIQAWENGYLPEYGEEPPTDDRVLLDAIRDDHMGTPRYSMHDQDAVEAYQAATQGNREIDRLAAEHGIETRGKTRDQFFDELHDRMSMDERAQEIASQTAAHEAAYRQAEQQAKQFGVEQGTSWNPRELYGTSQARTLEDLEREHAEEAQPHPTAPAQGERTAGEPEPGPPGEHQGAVPEGGEPRGGGAGDADRGAAPNDQATDLLGRQIAEPRAKAQPEPTIRNDTRQEAMPGMEPSAVQAQAARDAQGRGALQAGTPQKPADEGLFAPDESGQGVLYSGPSAIFDPAAWRRAFGAGPPLAPHEVLADKEGMARAAAEIKAGFAPTSLRGAKPMEYAIRRHTSETAQAHDIDVAALEKVRAATDRLSQQEQIEFSHRMETGQAQPTPELQKVADALRSVIDGWAKKVQGLGKGYLANAIENYMGHIWGNYREWSQGNAQPGRTQAQMQGAATAGNVRKQPLQGSGNFLKQRSFPTQQEGINAGLIPVTYNPVDLQLIKAHEMRKFYFGSVLADQIKSSGLARWVRDSDAREASDRGEVPLDDKIFQPKLYGVTPIGPVEPGKWYAPESAARVFNNYMSQGWANRSTIYDALRQSNNALNGLQLGIGGFHAAFVTNDVATSKVALGIQQIARGDFGRGAGNLLFGTPVVGHAAAITDSLRKGSQVRREWLDPGSGSPEVQRAVDAIKAGGFRMTMPDFFHSSTAGPFFKNWNDLKNPASVWQQSRQMFRDAPTVYQKAIMTPIRIAARTLDTVMQPLMGVMVPRAKAGVMYDLAADWLRRNPNASDHELASAMTKFQDSVDNRLGQLNYDNLFWNKTLKDAAFIMTRSVGWNLGTMREIGGAVPDTAKFLSAMSRGRFPELTTRMAYVMAMPAVTGMLGAVMTYMATGQGPQSMLDYFYPPTGGETQQGVPDRRSIPGYMKDVFAYLHDPIQTLLNKTSPMIEAMTEIRNNRDYYGGIIWDPERDRGPAQAYGDFLINQATPFSLRSWGRLKGEGAPALDQSLGFFGFQPAPASITNPERAQKFEQREQTKAYKAREKEVSKGLSMHIFNTPSGAAP